MISRGAHRQDKKKLPISDFEIVLGNTCVKMVRALGHGRATMPDIVLHLKTFYETALGWAPDVVPVECCALCSFARRRKVETTFQCSLCLLFIHESCCSEALESLAASQGSSRDLFLGSSLSGPSASSDSMVLWTRERVECSFRAHPLPQLASSFCLWCRLC